MCYLSGKESICQTIEEATTTTSVAFAIIRSAYIEMHAHWGSVPFYDNNDDNKDNDNNNKEERKAFVKL